jgi:trimeric autotransporter adhesin
MIHRDGNVGIGTTTPWAKLEVAGQVKITGGVPWAGKVLTSDASGLASWQTVGNTSPFGSSTAGWWWNGGFRLTTNAVDTGGGYFENQVNSSRPNWVLDVGWIWYTFWDGFRISRKVPGGGSFAYTDYLSILSNGNLGIGISSPTKKLDVAGDINFTGDLYKNWVLFSSSSSQWTTNGSSIYSANSGNVGVGTSAPSEKLQVNGNIATTGHTIYGPNPTWWSSLRVWGDGRNGIIDTAIASVATTNGNLHLDAGSASDTYINFYDGQAIHFGRGNNTDRALLNSAGLALYDGSFIGNLTGNAATATNLSTTRSNWSSNGTVSAVVGQLSWKNYGNAHTIFDASAGTSPDGTAVNQTNSQVAWSASYPTLMGWNGASTYGVRVDSARIADGSAGTTSSRFWMPDTDESPGWAKSIHANSNVIGFLDGYGSWLQYTNSAGQIWTPNYGWLHDKFLSKSSDTLSEVFNNGWYRSNGNAGWYSQTYGWGWWMTDSTWIRSYGWKYMYVDSVIQAGAYMNSPAYYYISDARLKKDLVKITSSLDKVTAMNGYYFKWKKDDKKDIGLIAQEVEKIFPDAVWEYTDPDSKKTYKNVEYGHLIAPVIEAIKELSVTVKAHTTEIDVLKSENELLKKRLDAIEARLSR